MSLTPVEHALRGWNWGKGELGKGELVFNVQNRPAFEIPYSEISNANLAGKNEVTIDFSVQPGSEQNGVNGHRGGAGKKAGMAKDQLMEMRFYVPGTVATKEKDEDGEEKSDADEVEEQNAANLFYETLMDKAQIGDVAGDTYATFLDVLHLTPRCVFYLSYLGKIIDNRAEDGSTSTCTRLPSGCVARHTTTNFNTTISKNSCFCLSRTTYTPLLWLALTRLCGRGRPNIPF